MGSEPDYGIIPEENWIAALPASVREAVEARMYVKDIVAGEIVASAGAPGRCMFNIERGFIRLNGLRDDGLDTLITVYQSGNSFAETSLVARRPYNHTSIALVDTRVRILTDEEFWPLYARHPEITDALCRKFAAIIGQQIKRREMIATRKLGQLIALMFENFAQVCAKGMAQPVDAVTIAFPITQNDIATLFDVTRQSVHREISLLRDRGLIDKQDGRWVVRHLERLRWLSN